MLILIAVILVLILFAVIYKETTLEWIIGLTNTAIFLSIGAAVLWVGFVAGLWIVNVARSPIRSCPQGQVCFVSQKDCHAVDSIPGIKTLNSDGTWTDGGCPTK